MQPLKITVVTVSYNAAATIEETIRSVVDQTYDNVEYIIIDGGSTDGTVDIIRRYAEGGSEAGKHNHAIAKWISEPDKGIYDAMNKGIDLATGDYINFMNSGDTFVDKKVIDNIFSGSMDCVVIYGKTIQRYTFGEYVVTPPPIRKLNKEMCVCHQSIFTNRKFIEPFDISLRIAGDHKALIDLYSEYPDSFKYVDIVIANYNAIDGISSINIEKSYKEQHTLASENASLFRRMRIRMRAKLPMRILNILCRIFFAFNRNYTKIS